MLEIFFIFHFIKKIKGIAFEKSISSAKWIALLLFSWFGAEFSVFIIGILILGQEDMTLLILMIPALAAAYFSATLVVKKLKAENDDSELELDEFVKQNDDDLKHFR